MGQVTNICLKLVFIEFLVRDGGGWLTYTHPRSISSIVSRSDVKETKDLSAKLQFLCVKK